LTRYFKRIKLEHHLRRNEEIVASPTNTVTEGSLIESLPRSTAPPTARALQPLPFAVVAAVLAIVVAGTAIPTPMLSLFEAKLSFSPLQAVILYASYNLGIVVALIATGMAGARLRLPRRLALGLTLTIIAALTFTVTGNYDVLLVARLLSGVATGLVTATATAALIDLGGQENRQRSAIIAIAANFVGLAVGAVLGGGLSSIGLLPLQLPFLADAALAVVIAACVVVVFRTHRPILPAGDGTKDTITQRTFGRLNARSRSVFGNAILPATAAFTANALLPAAASFYIAHELHVSSRAVVGLVIALGFVATALGQIVVHRLKLHSSQLTGRLLLLVGLGTLFVAFTTPSWAWLIVGSILVGVGTGVTSGVGLASLAQLEDESEVPGLINRYFVILYLGMFVPLTALGLIEQSLGVVAGTASACVVCAVVTVASVVTLVRSWRGAQAH
jgi:MFS family permease